MGKKSRIKMQEYKVPALVEQIRGLEAINAKLLAENAELKKKTESIPVQNP